jgi:arsenite-transporting ATPase
LNDVASIRSSDALLLLHRKGGVGKTSLACATAIALADDGKHVLLVSTDPASTLDQVLGVTLESVPTPIPAVPRLWALNIDPQAAAVAYRERVRSPLRGRVTDKELRDREEERSGACTVEIAAFDEFTGLLTHDAYGNDFDHVIFDTAPTGHTLRLLHLPAAWSTFLHDNPRGASSLGPHSALTQQQAQYADAVAALGDAERTTLVLVARPERGDLREAARTSVDLLGLGMSNQHLIVNGAFVATDRVDRIAMALEQRGVNALQEMPIDLASLPSSLVPLLPFNLVGVERLRRLLREEPASHADADIRLVRPNLPPLAVLVDELASRDRGLILVMGKGGVGKTTIAAAVAVELAARGHPVHLTTTDPAAHVASTIEGEVDNLTVSRIDPAAETEAYVSRVLATRGRGMTAFFHRLTL